MALPFAGAAVFSDASTLAPGSCAWVSWESRSGAPPGEVYFDVNPANGATPNAASIRTDLADAKRFHRFLVRIGGEPVATYEGEWIPGASGQPAAPSTGPATAGTDPIIRQLMCRGGPSGLEFKVIADPSPAYPDPPRQVRLALRYRVHLASDTAELALGSMSPGSCGWDMQFGAPKPRGEVIIDLETDAQASNASLGLPRDTSLRAGLSYTDTTTLKRYLSDPRHFWTFFHMDGGEPLVISHAPYEPDLTNLFVPVQKATTTTSGTSTGARRAGTGAPRDRGSSTTRWGATARAPQPTGSVSRPRTATDPGLATAGSQALTNPSASPSADTVRVGCYGGSAALSSGNLLTRDGALSRYQKPFREPETHTFIRRDSAAAALVFAELERIRFRTLRFSEIDNMTCSLDLKDRVGEHSVNWKMGRPPARLERVLALLKRTFGDDRPIWP